MKEYRQLGDVETSWNLSRYNYRRKKLCYVLEGEMFVAKVGFKIFHHVM